MLRLPIAMITTMMLIHVSLVVAAGIVVIVTVMTVVTVMVIVTVVWGCHTELTADDSGGGVPRSRNMDRRGGCLVPAS